MRRSCAAPRSSTSAPRPTARFRPSASPRRSTSGRRSSAARPISYRTGHRHDVAAIAEIAHDAGRALPRRLVPGDRRDRLRRARARRRLRHRRHGQVPARLGRARLPLRARRAARHGLLPTQTGWFADEDIFQMDISDYSPAADARRFDAGTPPVPNIYAGRRRDGDHRGGRHRCDRGAHRRAQRPADRRASRSSARRSPTPRDPSRRGPLVTVEVDRRSARSSRRSPRRRSSARSATRTCASRSTSTTSKRTSTACSTRCARTARCSRNRIVPMLLRELDYARPGSVDEAVKLLAAREDARALAGGQSLVNVMKTRVAAPELVVDLNGVDGLRGIEDDGGELVIGAMTTYSAIVDSAEVASARPILAECRADDRRRPGPQPRDDRRQRLLERPDQPLPAAARRARSRADDPGRGRRAYRRHGRVLRGRLRDGRATRARC